MEQIYFVRLSETSGRETPECIYQYGNYTYAGHVDVDLPEELGEVPTLVASLQSVQGDIPFVSETQSISEFSSQGKCLKAVRDAMDFVIGELSGIETELASLAETEPWLDSEDAPLYFEFQTRGTYTCEDANTVFAKRYHGDLMVTVIYYQTSFFVTLTEASGEQALVDTLFPQIYGRRRGLQLRSYEHAIFTRLSVWEASDPVPEPSTTAASPGFDEVDDSYSLNDAMVGGMDAVPGTEDLTGEGYTQIYVVMRPQGGRGSGTVRDALFRFGSWVYAGKVDFGVPALHLGDVPEVLPALQRQQGQLGFLCETSTFPTDNKLTPVVRQFLGAISFMEKEIVAAEPQLSELSELGITSWIDAEWAASFFELQFEPTPEWREVEVIASKVYFRSGIVLHTVLFGPSLYCVLADMADDMPLLDVAFPDVTARCRGMQVKAYGPNEGPLGAGMPRARKLLVWEGRRRGVPGVGWGSVAAVESDAIHGGIAEQIREKARERAQRQQESTATAMQGRITRRRRDEEQPVAEEVRDDQPEQPNEQHAEEGTGEGKEADVDVGETPDSVGQRSDPVAAEPVAGSPAPATRASASAGTREKEGEEVETSATGGAPVGGDRCGGEADPRPQPRSLGVVSSARAPHHLPPLGRSPGDSGRLLNRLPDLGEGAARAPWDSMGRPLPGAGAGEGKQ